jgi:hypothetical protein
MKISVRRLHHHRVSLQKVAVWITQHCKWISLLGSRLWLNCYHFRAQLRRHWVKHRCLTGLNPAMVSKVCGLNMWMFSEYKVGTESSTASVSAWHLCCPGPRCHFPVHNWCRVEYSVEHRVYSSRSSFRKPDGGTLLLFLFHMSTESQKCELICPPW